MLLPWRGLRLTKVSGRIGIIPLNRKTPIVMQMTIVIRSVKRNVLSGLHKRNSIKNPTNIIAITDIVDISIIGISNDLYKIKTAIKAQKLVSPAGIAFLNIFIRNLPRTILLLGSIAKINDGMPIIIKLYRINCMPSKGKRV